MCDCVAMYFLRAMFSDWLSLLAVSNQETERIGAALAIGSLPGFVLQKKIDAVMDGLISAALDLTPNSRSWGESRRDCLKALDSVFCRLPDREYFQKVLTCYLSAMEDYTQDSRGDIGKVVREMAVTRIQSLFWQLRDYPELQPLLTPSLVLEIVQYLLQQCSEKIDSSRKVRNSLSQCFLTFQSV